jgi:hypothetical protein
LILLKLITRLITLREKRVLERDCGFRCEKSILNIRLISLAKHEQYIWQLFENSGNMVQKFDARIGLIFEISQYIPFLTAEKRHTICGIRPPTRQAGVFIICS